MLCLRRTQSWHLKPSTVYLEGHGDLVTELTTRMMEKNRETSILLRGLGFRFIGTINNGDNWGYYMTYKGYKYTY